jgi:hypothetical protein
MSQWLDGSKSIYQYTGKTEWVVWRFDVWGWGTSCAEKCLTCLNGWKKSDWSGIINGYR